MVKMFPTRSLLNRGGFLYFSALSPRMTRLQLLNPDNQQMVVKRFRKPEAFVIIQMFSVFCSLGVVALLNSTLFLLQYFSLKHVDLACLNAFLHQVMIIDLKLQDSKSLGKMLLNKLWHANSLYGNQKQLYSS